MMTDASSHEGALAEFVALRNEILERVKAQHQYFVLQLTITGAVFAFAISQRDRIPFLLVLPFISYTLCGRLAAQHYGIVQAATYIRDMLGDRVSGNLEWERWAARNGRGPRLVSSTIPLFLTFVGASLVAVAWTAGVLFAASGPTGWAWAGLTVVWLFALAATALSSWLIIQIATVRLR